MDQFDLKYREGLPLVLKQISCDIKPGEKVQKQARVYLNGSSSHYVLLHWFPITDQHVTSLLYHLYITQQAGNENDQTYQVVFLILI